MDSLKSLLKNTKVQLLLLAATLVVLGMVFHFDVGAFIDSLAAIADKLGGIVDQPAPVDPAVVAPAA